MYVVEAEKAWKKVHLCSRLMSTVMLFALFLFDFSSLCVALIFAVQKERTCFLPKSSLLELVCEGADSSQFLDSETVGEELLDETVSPVFSRFLRTQYVFSLTFAYGQHLRIYRVPFYISGNIRILVSRNLSPAGCVDFIFFCSEPKKEKIRSVRVRVLALLFMKV